jgi:hypothetical protein
MKYMLTFVIGCCPVYNSVVFLPLLDAPLAPTTLNCVGQSAVVCECWGLTAVISFSETRNHEGPNEARNEGGRAQPHL